MRLLFLDTETSGLPLYHDPSDDPRQPHLTEIAFFVIDGDTGTLLVDPFMAVIRTNGWDIPDEVAALNGLTKEILDEDGRDEAYVLDHLRQAMEQADVRVAFNEPFDRRIGRIGFKRYASRWTLGDDGVPLHDRWNAMESLCVMQLARPLAAIPAKTPGKFKSPSLVEAMKAILGEDYQETHRALPDVLAAYRLWHAITKPGWTLPVGVPQ